MNKKQQKVYIKKIKPNIFLAIIFMKKKTWTSPSKNDFINNVFLFDIYTF
jgi:hypothetical protein